MCSLVLNPPRPSAWNCDSRSMSAAHEPRRPMTATAANPLLAGATPDASATDPANQTGPKAPPPPSHTSDEGDVEQTRKRQRQPRNSACASPSSGRPPLALSELGTSSRPDHVRARPRTVLV
nr:hypothetical protein CFP56_01105 [Quercus suber]